MQDGMFWKAYSQPLSIVNLAGAEERIQGVVGWDNETSKVGEQLAAEVEKDEEEVQAESAQESVDLWDIGLALEVVQDRILRELKTSVSTSLGAYSKIHQHLRGCARASLKL
jgi:hypothetical protein